MNDQPRADLDAWLRLLRAACPQACALWVEDGNVLHVAATSMASIRRSVRPGIAAIAVGTQVWPVLRRPLNDFSGEPFGTACLVLSPNAAEAALADAVAEGIEREWRLGAELDQIAEELGERYDELNFVYASGDDADCGDDRDDGSARGETSLVPIARSALVGLGASLLVIDIPGRGARTHAGGAPGAAAALGIDENACCREFARRVAQAGGPVVLNELDERVPWSGHVANRAVAAPIRSTDGGTLGVVWALRGPDARDFLNSERQLVDVVARNAARQVEATWDGLTRVLNRPVFETRARALLQAGDRAGEPCALMVLGVDKLGIVNDLHGYGTGDRVIREIADALRNETRGRYVVGRRPATRSGSCCGVVTRRVRALGDRLRAVAGERATALLPDHLRISISVGVAALGEDESASIVLDHAEVALKSAKESGGDRLRSWGGSDDAAVRRQEDMRAVAMIHAALDEDRFRLYAQPIAHCNDPSNIDHYEILLRLEDADGTIVPPMRFLPAAERFRLMPVIDRWVVERTLATILPAIDADPGETSWAINLSGQSLSDERFMQRLATLVTDSGVPAARLVFEVTETIAISDVALARAQLTRLQALGCRVHLDDFGTGVSTFEYLKQLPVDGVKIDGVFVRDVTSDPFARATVEAVNQIAHLLGLQTIAEFVEDEACLAVLREIGVDRAQGYGIGRPEPVAEQLERIAARWLPPPVATLDASFMEPGWGDARI